jgi:hypothetical protein
MNSMCGLCDWFKFKGMANEKGLAKSGSNRNTFGDTQTALPYAYTFTLANVGNGT